MKEPGKVRREVTRVWMSRGDKARYEEAAAGSVVRHVQGLDPSSKVRVEVDGSEVVWERVKEGLKTRAGVEVRSPTVGGTSDTTVSRVVVGEETVGENVLCVSRVGVVLLVDANWTMERYAEWAERWYMEIREKTGVSGDLKGVVYEGFQRFTYLIDHLIPSEIPTDEQTLIDLKTIALEFKVVLERYVGVVRGAAMDEERRGVLLRGIVRGIGAVDSKVLAIDEALDALDAGSGDDHTVDWQDNNDLDDHTVDWQDNNDLDDNNWELRH